ncbi:hypothetical protein RFI_01703 [Reticulomyxa filosa]|uniref:Uncharacterized protein n=1 Tax=Reticulomyxa filosa TaxID=46433 RepID=X6PB45_RETFI|nr:hypothetical protein RFI_01703 [Reticulomyxa filosa]|eukprot:ETO35361.1 hypothetical protein RFI_01703 [Reticulomyxa filosa]
MIIFKRTNNKKVVSDKPALFLTMVLHVVLCLAIWFIGSGSGLKEKYCNDDKCAQVTLEKVERLFCIKERSCVNSQIIMHASDTHHNYEIDCAGVASCQNATVWLNNSNSNNNNNNNVVSIYCRGLLSCSFLSVISSQPRSYFFIFLFYKRG